MSYCVNCGVELDASAASCPLCGTPVVNPNELMKKEEAQIPFPAKKGQVEAVKPKDLGVLLTMLVLAAAALCGALNAFVFRDSMWALTVAGACALLWVILEPFVICTRQPVYLSLFLDGAAVVFLMYMITFLTRDMGWFLHLGIPLAVLVTAVAEAFAFCILKLPKSFLTVLLYFFTAVGLLCAGIETLVDRYVNGVVDLRWSAVVVTVCGILDIVFVTMLSQKRLRNAIRRRLHF